MKNIKILFLAITLIFSYSLTAQVAISSDGSSADGSAMLEVKSTNKGFLPPRMTYEQRISIASPATGLMIWCIDCGIFGELQLYNGSTWIGIPTSAAVGAVPGVPTIGTATAGIAKAWVAFTAPASNGGSTITSYTATSSPGSITGTLAQAGSGTITVTELTNGTAYTFTVTATNEVGIGAASDASNSVTPLVLLPNDVFNPTTGKTWMDRNLGATRAATSSTDAQAYGDLYQWGRGTDGHQIRTSITTTTLSSNDNPGHANFIIAPSSPYDWHSPQNNYLWLGVSGTNNPCPAGYRLPTENELEAERGSWSSNNSAGAYASPLKLPVAGFRWYGNGLVDHVGSGSDYWSCTVDGTKTRELNFYSSHATTNSDFRAFGFSIRCIKD